MKLSLLTLLAIAVPAFTPLRAQTEAKETPEHKALKSRYQADVAAAIKPVQSRYVFQLESLLRSYTQRGDLGAALAVQQDLDALKNARDVEDPTAHRSTQTAIIGTWSWQSTDRSDQNTIQFAKDGTGSHGARSNTKWEATSNREITVTHPTKGEAVLRLSPDSQSFSGTGYNGKPVTGKRMQ